MMHYIHRQIGFGYLMVNEYWLKCFQCWLLNNKRYHPSFELSQVNYPHTPIEYPKCTVAVSGAYLQHTYVYTSTHAYCWPVLCGSGLEVSFLTECTSKAQSPTMSQTTSGPPHPSLAFTSGLLKNDISSWRASISICILLEARRFRAEDISALSRQNQLTMHYLPFMAAITLSPGGERR